MDDIDVEEMDRIIAAHAGYLAKHGVNFDRLPQNLTALDAFAALTRADVEGASKSQRQLLAIIRSLRDLCGFRTRAVGIDRVRAALEREAEAATGEAEGKKRRKRKLKAIDFLYDDAAVKDIERRVTECQRRMRTFLRAVQEATGHVATRLDGRFRRAGLAGVGVPALAHARMEDHWIVGVLENTLAELDWYVAAKRGAASSDAIGYRGIPDGKAWRAVRDRCQLHVKHGGGTQSVQRQLFPAATTDPVREKNRNEKRVYRARRRAKSNG